MRVLHFYKTSLPDTMGGVEQVIHQIALGVKKHGIETDVLSLTPNIQARTMEYNGYLVHQAKRDLQIASTGFSASVFFRFSELAKKADVIHYHFPWPFMDVVHFATRVRKPTIVTYHSDIIRQKNLLKVYRPLQHRFLNSVGLIIATSPNYLKSSSVLNKFPDKTRIIPIGLDKSTYPVANHESLTSWKEKLGPKFFLFVGVLRYYKGLHILLKAAQHTNYPIAIVGAGPIEHELKAQATELGLKNIYFLGYLPDAEKVALLTLCLAVIFPSHLRSEAFGISLLEGAMYGKPMISSEIGTGTTFINIANETGLTIPPSDANALRQAMAFLWNNPERAEEMGALAEKRYLEYFTAETMSTNYAKLYRELASKTLQPGPDFNKISSPD